MTVKGCGKLVFDHYSDFWGALTVQDTATVAVNPGCGFSRDGKTTVNSGATIEVAQSGSLSFGRDLSLAEGAPKWAKGVRIENNEIVLDVITLGTYIFVK